MSKEIKKVSRAYLPWSKTVWAVSVAITLLVILLAVYLAFDKYIWLSAILVLFLLMIILVMPIYASVSRSQLRIHRILSQKVFRVEDYDIYDLPREFASRSLRVCGIGGLYCIYGWFHNKTLGDHFRHTVSNNNLLLLVNKEDQKKYLINFPPQLRKSVKDHIKAFDPSMFEEE